MDTNALERDKPYTNADESETREIRQFIHRDGKDFVRYRYRDKAGWYGENWSTRAQFAAWAHHVARFRLAPRVRQNSRPKPKIIYFNWND